VVSLKAKVVVELYSHGICRVLWQLLEHITVDLLDGVLYCSVDFWASYEIG